MLPDHVVINVMAIPLCADLQGRTSGLKAAPGRYSALTRIMPQWSETFIAGLCASRRLIGSNLCQTKPIQMSNIRSQP